MSAAPPNLLRSLKLPLLFAAVCLLFGFVGRMVCDRAASISLRGGENGLEQRDAEIRTDVLAAFAAYQQSTREVVDALARRPELRAAINDDSLTELEAFEAVKEATPLPVTLELWGPGRVLWSWSGPRGVSTDTAALTDSEISLLQSGPIYSYFTIVKPVPGGSGKTWHIVAKRLFDVNYPITNQFIDNTVFETAFGTSLGYPVKISPGTGLMHPADSTLLAIPLPSIAGAPIATAYVDRPTPQDLADENTSAGARLAAAFYGVAALALLWTAFSAWRGGRGWAGYLLLVLLWCFRYLLIWLDVPGVFIASPFVDPSVFASPFGGGLARSVADLFITALVLAASCGLISSLLLRLLPRAATLPRAVRVAGVAAAALITAAVIRGLVAALRSAVLDSTLAYNDPAFILPPAELGMMLAALALIALSALIVLSVLATLSAAWCGGVSKSRSWFLWFAAAVLVGAVYGELLQNPLLGHVGRTAVLALITLTARLTWGARTRRPLRMALIVLAAAAILLFPLLDEQMHYQDARRIELLAQEMNRPPDAWMTVLINQALDQLSGGEAADILSFGSAEEVRKLAFTQWAKSILSREGNTCAVLYVENGDSVVSDFHIGLTPHRIGGLPAEGAPAKRYVELDRTGGASGTRWHRGYAPLLRGDGTPAGGVWLEVGEERGLGARSGAPEFLTNFPRERSDNHYRRLVVSEYISGRLATSSDETFPADRQLPAKVAAGGAFTLGGWTDETIAGNRYETYYVPLQTGVRDAWIALSLENLDVQWHLYSYLRSFLSYLLFIMLPVGLFLVALNRNVLAGLSRFKSRLTLAFVLVSLVPIVLLAVYNKTYVEGRVRDADARRLREQTQIGLNGVQRLIGTATPFSLAQLTDEQCITLSEQWGTDFNVFAGNTLQASSRPEVVTAELVDTRLSAGAYAAIVLQHHGFFSEEQSIGRLPYLVGYRPILSDDGRVVGVFSVPTLFRQREIDEMATRRNIFLFGTYALALLLAIALSTVVGNQISKPILRLKEATSLVAGGNLDLRIRSGRKDEIGELEESFDEMTTNLKRSQDEIVKTQRELAWREMARQVAHEIKNPLTPMRLSVQHLQQAYRDRVADFDALLGRITGTVLEQIDALSRIASEFSSFARMPPRAMQPCSVHAIIRDVAALFQQKDLAVGLSLGAANDVVRADPDELRRVLINILRNSVQAMNGKGSVNVTTSSSARMLTVRLADTGPGIPPEIRQKLFQPNFSTKSEGMGLGLAIVKRAVEDLGGSVAVESAVGSGTTFILRIPVMAS